MTSEPIVIHPGSLCLLEHRCAVCGEIALHSEHGTRGHTWQRDGYAECPPEFRVRCEHCQRENRKNPGQVLAIEIADQTKDYLEFRKRCDSEAAIFEVF